MFDHYREDLPSSHEIGLALGALADREGIGAITARSDNSYRSKTYDISEFTELKAESISGSLVELGYREGLEEVQENIESIVPELAEINSEAQET